MKSARIGYVFTGLVMVSLLGCSGNSPRDPSASDVPKSDKALAESQAISTNEGDIAADPAMAETAALSLLEHQKGAWNSRWEWLNAEGEIIGEMKGVETFSSIIDTYSQSLKSVNTTFNQTSHALLTYNKVDQKIVFFSLGADGDYWIMRQDPFTGTMISEPHKGTDGRYQILRFTTLSQTTDAMSIQMEYSFDDGVSWTTGFRQFMTRA